MAALPVLHIEIKNVAPVELLDLASSFQALGQEYIQHSKSGHFDISDEDIRLYIKTIQDGSIVAELVSLAQQTSFILNHGEVLVSFCSSIKDAYDWFLGKSSDKPTLPPRGLRNLSQFVAPVAKDSGSQLNIGVHDRGTVVMNFNLNSIEANAIQNRIAHELARVPKDDDDFFEKELLLFYQARDDPKAQTGDKGVIDRLSKRPVKLLFASEEVKRQILDRKENIFRLIFVVDVRAHKLDGRTVAYTVYRVHEVFEKPED